MSAHYDFYKNPPAAKEPDKAQLHPRIVSHHTVTPQELAQSIQARCTATTADVKVVLESLRSVMVQALKEGDRVHVDGIGYFSITLEAEPIQDKKGIRAESVHFKSVSFKPEAQLKKSLDGVRLERNPNKAHSKMCSDAEIAKRLDKYFEHKQTITRDEFQQLCGLLRTTAQRKLNELKVMGKLRNVGYPRYAIYERT